jgi:predicted YcjX-like family ATPase
VTGGSGGGQRGSLAALLARRFESYKAHVVQPFFRDHFARLDRQIVLVDALSAVNGGPDALRDLERTLAAVLACFDTGASSWFSWLLPRRIDRLVFAATKADHLHHGSHDRLEAVLRWLTDKAIARAEYAGAEVKTMALAAVRATREAEARPRGTLGWQRLPCIMGVPLPGERLEGKVFDGRTEAAVFPGDLPEDPASLLDGAAVKAVHFPRFRPPRLMPGGAGEAAVLPHIRLDRALDFLLGDKLA